MQNKSKCRRTTVVRDTWNQVIHNPKRYRVGNQKENQCGIKRKLYLQASRQGHLLRMWVIFREHRSMYTHIDRNVFAIVEDKDILEFQRHLATTVGEMIHEIMEHSEYLQNFVGNEYFARRYVPMTPNTGMTVPLEPPKLEIPKASLFRDVELPSPCSSGQ